MPLLKVNLSEATCLLECNRLADALQQQQVTLSDPVTRIVRKSAHATRLLVVIDQFEELFTLCPEAESVNASWTPC